MNTLGTVVSIAAALPTLIPLACGLWANRLRLPTHNRPISTVRLTNPTARIEIACDQQTQQAL